MSDFRLAMLGLLILTLCTSCNAKPLRYEGDVDTRMEAFFERLPPKSVLYLTSKGGKESIALKIANIVAEKQIAIKIDRFCESGCAQYIMLASPHLEIEKGAVITFHINSYGARNVVGRTDVEDDANAAAELYDKLQVDRELLIDSFLGVAPYCMRSGTTSGWQAYSSWIPTRQQLEKWNVHFEGYWPSSREEAIENTAKIYRPGSKIAYGEPQLKVGDPDINICD